MPCETQQSPDLRSDPGAAPDGQKVTVPAAAHAAYQAMIDKAAAGLRRNIARQGLSDQLKVSTEPITAQGLATAAKQATGGGG